MEWLLLPYVWAFASGRWPDPPSPTEGHAWTDPRATDVRDRPFDRLDLEVVSIVYRVLVERIEGVASEEQDGPRITVEPRPVSAGVTGVKITVDRGGRHAHRYTAQVRQRNDGLWFGEPAAVRAPTVSRILTRLTGWLPRTPDDAIR